MDSQTSIDKLAQDFLSGNDIDLENITVVIGHFSRVQVSEITQTEDQFFKKLIDYLSKSTFYQQDYAIQEAVLKLFDQLVDLYTFETFTARIAPLQEIISAIDETQNSLILLSLGKLILKASPIDILANTELVKILVLKLSSDDVSIAIMNTVETLILQLSQGELIRRRLLSKEVISILEKMRHGKIETMVRLFDLISMTYLRFASVDELPISLFKTNKVELENDDIMYPVSIIHFYNRVLEKIIERNLKWLLNELDFDLIIDLLYDEEYLFKGLISNEITIMLGKLSYCEARFIEIDHKYGILSRVKNEYYYDTEFSAYFLSVVNPRLLQDDDDFLSNLKLSTNTLPIFMNLVGNSEIFPKLNVSTSDLKKLPSMLELFTILEKFSEHTWSSIYLLNSLPLIMNLLLDSVVINPKIVDLKKQILTNLLLHQDELSIWYSKIKTELNKLISGASPTPQVTVHDSIL